MAALKKEQFEQENKEENVEYSVPVEDRLNKVVELLKVMARSAVYAKVSESWL
jgi:hypothetical protein